MRDLATILRLFWRAHRPAFLYGLALTLATMVAGAALLGLSGWFIVASGVAGAAGAGLTFDFFRPSAGVRFLALARAAARYGERLTTHDATLRFLAALRTRLFRALAARPYAALGRLRRATALNRLTADVDALDAAYLRLFAPAASGLAALALALWLLWAIVAPAVALWVVGVLLAAGIAAAAAGAARGRRPSRLRALALEALRVRIVDLSRGAVDLALAGRFEDQERAVLRADAMAANAARRLDRLDRTTGAGLELAVACAAAGALALGASLGLGAAITAVGVFAALALGETVAPLRRGALDLGRTLLAARRVAPVLRTEAPAAPPASPVAAAGAPLAIEAVVLRRPGGAAPVLDGASLRVEPAEWVALTGPSGCGKSTLLGLAAAMEPPQAGRVLLWGRDAGLWPEPALRARLAVLPQRAELFSGTLADNLRLADPQADEDALWAALDAVALRDASERAGGLDAPLGEGGAGLSGGEQRRLALARIILRRPALMLLDEPCEGLDAATARRVLSGLRAALPEAAALIASHRPEERAAADRVVALARAALSG
ncbi:MAG: amino acid ABC transporter ATP-binding/permease protein [Rubrimonas sp.]|uniref:amino acid ABC transporter ATP-binding/permease protein n=1 Tax=Rubrimonas sp. TaxID=2036015 RepID=UPI002FDCD0F1